MKLATRMHAKARRVIRAYAEGKSTGNLVDLLEPGHGPLFAPFVFDNTRFPDDGFEKSTRPDSSPEMDAYYRQALDRVLVNSAENA